MEDPGCRKLPPDRELTKLEPPDRAKKSRKEDTVDDLMGERMLDEEELNAGDSNLNAIPAQQGIPDPPQQPSYKDSLLGYKNFKGKGFNGAAHGGGACEEDPLITDIQDQTWEIPNPTEDMLKLMEIYPVVPITHEEFNEGCEQWNKALVITVLGARFQLTRLKEILSRLWKFSDFELVDIPNNYFVVRFNDDESWAHKYRRVLFEGPWVVAQHTVLVQRWSPHFDPFTNPLGRIATWVRIPNIPLHCYTKKILWRLGDRIGKTLKVDMNTMGEAELMRTRVERGRFARLCVEIDLQKKLIPRVICASALFNVEYEGLGLICFGCGRYGHRREACPAKASPSEGNVNPVMRPTHQKPVPEPNQVSAEEFFGPWMLAKKPVKAWIPRRGSESDRKDDGGNKKVLSQKGDVKTSSSRYAALADLEEAVSGQGPVAVSSGDIMMSDIRGEQEPVDFENETRNPVRVRGLEKTSYWKPRVNPKQKMGLNQSPTSNLAQDSSILGQPSAQKGVHMESSGYPKGKGSGPKSKGASQRTHVVISGDSSLTAGAMIQQSIPLTQKDSLPPDPSETAAGGRATVSELAMEHSIHQPKESSAEREAFKVLQNNIQENRLAGDKVKSQKKKGSKFATQGGGDKPPDT